MALDEDEDDDDDNDDENRDGDVGDRVDAADSSGAARGDAAAVPNAATAVDAAPAVSPPPRRHLRRALAGGAARLERAIGDAVARSSLDAAAARVLLAGALALARKVRARGPRSSCVCANDHRQR